MRRSKKLRKCSLLRNYSMLGIMTWTWSRSGRFKTIASRPLSSGIERRTTGFQVAAGDRRSQRNRAEPPLMVRSVRVRHAVRRPGKCEESDNQETGLCVVTLRASKWLPTTIYRCYTFTDTVRERHLGGDWLERNKAGLCGGHWMEQWRTIQ